MDSTASASPVHEPVHVVNRYGWLVDQAWIMVLLAGSFGPLLEAESGSTTSRARPCPPTTTTRVCSAESALSSCCLSGSHQRATMLWYSGWSGMGSCCDSGLWHGKHAALVA
jgi:hypothetical protein